MKIEMVWLYLQKLRGKIRDALIRPKSSAPDFCDLSYYDKDPEIE